MLKRSQTILLHTTYPSWVLLVVLAVLSAGILGMVLGDGKVTTQVGGGAGIPAACSITTGYCGCDFLHPYFGDYTWAAARIVSQESGCNPTAYNPAFDTRGLFQVATVHCGESYSSGTYSVTLSSDYNTCVSQLETPETNAIIGAALSQGGRAWSYGTFAACDTCGVCGTMSLNSSYCGPTCVDECAEDAAACYGRLRVTCGEANDGDTCRDWVVAQTCAANCSGGACVDAPSRPLVTYPTCRDSSYTATIVWNGTERWGSRTDSPSGGFSVNVSDKLSFSGVFSKRYLDPPGYGFTCGAFGIACETNAPSGPSKGPGCADTAFCANWCDGSTTNCTRRSFDNLSSLEPAKRYYARVFNGIHSETQSWFVPRCTSPPGTGQRGDANCDGQVTSVDAQLVLQYSAGLGEGGNCSRATFRTATDVDRSSTVTSIDALIILQYVAGLISSLDPLGGIAGQADTDGDFMTDSQELAYSCLNRFVHDSRQDSDGDQLENSYELAISTNPCDSDTDDDTISDFREDRGIASQPELQTKLGTDPLRWDTDKDGCSDGRELGPFEAAGGRRDPTNPYDYYDINHDGAISIPVDILGVAGAFGTGSPKYHPSKDRAASFSAELTPDFWTSWKLFWPGVVPPVWEKGPPNGSIDVPSDILGVSKQFGHACPHNHALYTGPNGTPFGPHPVTLSAAIALEQAAPFAVPVNLFGVSSPAANFPSSGKLLIDAETLTYNQTSGQCPGLNTATQLCITARGNNIPIGSVPALHPISAIVYGIPNTLQVRSTLNGSPVTGVAIEHTGWGTTGTGGTTNYTLTRSSDVDSVIRAPLTFNGANFISWTGCSPGPFGGNECRTTLTGGGVTQTVTANY